MALQYALSGVARVGNTRSNYYNGAIVAFTINGTDRTRFVNKFECEVHDILNETPNTATLVVRGFTPTVGMAVTIRLGSTHGVPLFDGLVVSLEPVRRRTGIRVRYRLECIDWMYLLDRLLVNKDYASLSGSAIAPDLISTFTTGFTAVHVESGLATVDLPNKMERVSQALTRLANLTGAVWYIDGTKDLHFLITETATSPTALTTANKTFKRLKSHTSLEQVRTRVYVEGQGTAVRAPVSAGDTILPVETAAMFDPVGGHATVPSERLTYTAVERGADGSLVGPGVTPSSAMSPAASAGVGIESGDHVYAFTWVTGAGETLPSPLATVTHGAISGPSVAPTINSLSGNADGTTNLAIGTTYEYVYTYSAHPTPYTDLTEDTAPSTAVTYLAILAATLGVPYAQYPNIRVTASDDERVYWMHLFRRVQGVGNYQYIRSSTNATQNLVGYNAGGADLPAANATFNRSTLDGIAVGPSGTTSRKVYRTVAGGVQLKLQQTIANNTATTGTTDTTVDASLGANAPSADTSGLTQPDGQVNQGDTSLIVASTTAFLSTGGWAVIGNGEQVIRYTGHTGGALTGIPAAGVGAIVAPVSYNSTITACPMLTGIPTSGAGALTTALVPGDEINLLVVEDATAAQTALAALEGGDGIHEHYIQDRRLSLAGATVRAQAELALGSTADETVTVVSEDFNACSGRTLTVSVTGIAVTARIQQVRFHWVPGRAKVQREITATNRLKGFYQYVRDLDDKTRRVA